MTDFGEDNNAYDEEGEVTIISKGLTTALDKLRSNESTPDSGVWSHCHSVDLTSRKTDKSAKKKLIIACFLCLGFMSAEAVGGVLSNSVAIATDAAHLLIDLTSFSISLFSIWMASRPASKRFNFGWYRAEVIGALTSILLIWAITAILVYMAIQRLISKKYEIEATVMLVTAGVGILFNIIMGCQLNGLPGGHGHSHGGHKNPDEVALLDDMENGPNKKEKNINVRAAFIHVLGDLIHSVGVFCAAIVVYFKPEWSFVDPICTFFFSILVLSTTSVILRDVLNVFMEGAPRNIDFLKVQKCLATIPGVVTVHNLRIWALSLDKVAMSAHIAIDQGFNPIEVIETASRTVQSRFDIFESTIQVEEYRSDMDHCLQCKSL